MAWIRFCGLMPVRRARIRRLLNRPEVNLMFGCGDTAYPGWVGVDCFYSSNVTLTLDLRRLLPLPTSSVDCCYSEHFLEHLQPDECQRHINEVFRVLKPGARYRVVVPNALEFAQRYLDGDVEFFQLACPWVARPLEGVYNAVNWGGAHRNIMDYEELARMAAAAGFELCLRSYSNASELPIFRIDRGEPHRVAESLYVEMIKSNAT